MDSLRGQPRAYQSLLAYSGFGRLSGSLLFEGPVGSGRHTAARMLAADLLDDTRPLRGAHPDCVEWSGAAGASVVEELVQLVGKLPFEGWCTVAVILDADRLSEAALNALLKTIEEPGDRMTVVLTVVSSATLPDTVRSRCVRVPFGPLSMRDRVGILRGMGITNQLVERALFSATVAEAAAGGWEKRRDALHTALERLRMARTTAEPDFTRLLESLGEEDVHRLVEAALWVDGRPAVASAALTSATMLQDSVRPESAGAHLLLAARRTA